MTENIINEIQELFLNKCVKNNGVIFDCYETQEVGINCTHFTVIGFNGIYSGHYTYDVKIPDEEEEIIKGILEEDCNYWEQFSVGELQEYLDFLEGI